jgi:hypothetical protein
MQVVRGVLRRSDTAVRSGLDWLNPVHSSSVETSCFLCDRIHACAASPNLLNVYLPRSYVLSLRGSHAVILRRRPSTLHRRHSEAQ